MSMKKHHPRCAKLNQMELENTCDCHMIVITPITDKHAFHRITGLADPNGDVVAVQIARDLECQLTTQTEIADCAEKNLYDLVALLSGKTPDSYNASFKEIADGFLKRTNQTPIPRKNKF